MFRVLAVEPATDDVFGPEVAEAMRLPFDRGWDHWGIYQGDQLIAPFDDYDLAVRTCAALNNTVLFEAA